MASSKSSTQTTDSTGPKISSRATRISRLTAQTVGWVNRPWRRSPSLARPPPAWQIAPSAAPMARYSCTLSNWS